MKFRRHTPEWRPRFRINWSWPRIRERWPNWPTWTGGRWPRWVWGGTFLGAAFIGYLLAALILFPAPFFTSNRTVPNLLTMELEEAEVQLARRGLELGSTESRSHLSAPEGTIIWQDPPPNLIVTEGTAIEVSFSAGPPRVPIPDISGYQTELARVLIEGAGLRVANTETAQTDAPRGVAVNTRPPPGTVLTAGSGITVVVSAGAPTITVPDLLGLTLEAARERLEEVNLQVGTQFRRSAPGSAAGTVVGQRPAAGTLIAPGSAIGLEIARERSR